MPTVSLKELEAEDTGTLDARNQRCSRLNVGRGISEDKEMLIASSFPIERHQRTLNRYSQAVTLTFDYLNLNV